MKIEDIFSDMPELETERIKLRKIQPTDAEDMFEYASDTDVTRYLSYDHKEIEETQKYIEKKQNQYALGQCMIWGAEYKENKKYIGAFGFTHWSPEDGCAEIAYTLSQKYWGKGIAKEIASKIMEFGFDKMELNRIEARCFAENEKSAKLLIKLNMKYEGTIREQLLIKGKHRDIKVYSILKREYNESK